VEERSAQRSNGLADNAACLKVERARVERARRQIQQSRDTAEEHRNAEELGVARLDLRAPEVMPREVAKQNRNEVRGIAEELERRFRHERADTTGEVLGGARGQAEKPHRVVLRVTDE